MNCSFCVRDTISVLYLHHLEKMIDKQAYMSLSKEEAVKIFDKLQIKLEDKLQIQITGWSIRIHSVRKVTEQAEVVATIKVNEILSSN